MASSFVSGNANSTGTSNTEVIAAQAAGVRVYLTDIHITNASATATEVIIKDGTTEVTRLPAPANGGAISNRSSPFVGTAATAWQFALADSLGSGNTVYVEFGGFTCS